MSICYFVLAAVLSQAIFSTCCFVHKLLYPLLLCPLLFCPKLFCPVTLLYSWRITTFWHSLDNTDNFFKVWERHGLELGMNFLVVHQNFIWLFATNLAFNLHTRNCSLYKPKTNCICMYVNRKIEFIFAISKSYLNHVGQFLVMQVISSSRTIFNENFRPWHCYKPKRWFDINVRKHKDNKFNENKPVDCKSTVTQPLCPDNISILVMWATAGQNPEVILAKNCNIVDSLGKRYVPSENLFRYLK